METDKTQLDRFKETARRLDTDDDEERFNERLGKLAKKKPLTQDSTSESMSPDGDDG